MERYFIPHEESQNLERVSTEALSLELKNRKLELLADEQSFRTVAEEGLLPLVKLLLI